MPYQSSLRSRQRGAIAMMTGIFLFLALMCLVLVVDSGRLYYEQRQLQKIADTTALDTATEGGLCSISGSPSLLQLATASAQRNGFAGDLSSSPSSVRSGYVQTVDGVRNFMVDGSRREAVEVVVGKTVPASIVAGGIIGQSVSLQARAVAQRQPIATFSVGSALLRVNTAESALLNPLLTGLLGGSTHVNLDAVSYQGIVDANVSLLELMQSASLLGSRITVGAVDSALNTSISLASFMAATVDVLDRKNVAAAALLRNQLVGVRSATLKLADVLALDAVPGMTEEALNARVNVLDLITAAAMAANRGNAVALDMGVAGAGVSLRVIEPPRIAVGQPGMHNGVWRTSARTAQVQLNVATSPNLLGLLAGNIVVGVNVAEGQAWFSQARCRTLATGTTRVDISGRSSLVGVSLHDGSGGNANVQASLAGIPLLRAEVGLATAIGSSGTRDVSYLIANKREELPEMKTVASGNGLATSFDNLSVRITFPIAINLDFLTNLLRNQIVGGLLNNVINPLVTPLLALLGIQPGVLDVTLVDVQEAPASLLQ